MDRTVALNDTLGSKTGFLELPVHVTCKDKHPRPQPFAHATQNVEPRMRHGRPIEVQTMSVEAPGQFGIVDKGTRIGNLFKTDAGGTECRISPPETLRPAKIGQTRIDAESGTGSKQQTIGLRDQFGTAAVARRKINLFMLWRLHGSTLGKHGRLHEKQPDRSFRQDRPRRVGPSRAKPRAVAVCTKCPVVHYSQKLRCNLSPVPPRIRPGGPATQPFRPRSQRRQRSCSLPVAPVRRVTDQVPRRRPGSWQRHSHQNRPDRRN